MARRREGRLTLRPRDWGIGVAATVALIITIALILATVLVGLFYVVAAILSQLLSQSQLP